MTEEPGEPAPSEGGGSGDGEAATVPADHIEADREAVLHEASPAYDRENLARLLSDVVAEGTRKVRSGRVKSPERERVRLKWVRATAYAIDRLNAVLADAEADGEVERNPESFGVEPDEDLLDGVDVDLDAVEAELGGEE